MIQRPVSFLLLCEKFVESCHHHHHPYIPFFNFKNLAIANYSFFLVMADLLVSDLKPTIASVVFLRCS